MDVWKRSEARRLLAPARRTGSPARTPQSAAAGRSTRQGQAGRGAPTVGNFAVDYDDGLTACPDDALVIRRCGMTLRKKAGTFRCKSASWNRWARYSV